MARSRNREAVLKVLRKALDEDRTKTFVVEISPLGLVEMTRQNVTDGVREIMTKPCPVCQRRGRREVRGDDRDRVRAPPAPHGHRGRRRTAPRPTCCGSTRRSRPGSSPTARASCTSSRRETGRYFHFEGSDGLPLDHFAVTMEGTRAEIEEHAVPFRAGEEVHVHLVEPHMYNDDDAVAKVDGYLIDVVNGVAFVGEKKLVRIEEAGRTIARAVLVGADAEAAEEAAKERAAAREKALQAARRSAAAKKGAAKRRERDDATRDADRRDAGRGRDRARPRSRTPTARAAQALAPAPPLRGPGRRRRGARRRSPPRSAEPRREEAAEARARAAAAQARRRDAPTAGGRGRAEAARRAPREAPRRRPQAADARKRRPPTRREASADAARARSQAPAEEAERGGRRRAEGAARGQAPRRAASRERRGRDAVEEDPRTRGRRRRGGRTTTRYPLALGAAAAEVDGAVRARRHKPTPKSPTETSTLRLCPTQSSRPAVSSTRVIEGQTLLIERLPDDVGATVALKPLLLAGDGDPVFEGDGLRPALVDGRDRRAPARAEAARLQVQAQARLQAPHGPPSGTDAHQDHRRSRARGEGLMAHKKGLGSSRNGRDSNAKRLGVKVFAGQTVTGGEIIVRQRGTSSSRATASASARTTRSTPARRARSTSREGRRGRVISRSSRPSSVRVTRFATAGLRRRRVVRAQPSARRPLRRARAAARPGPPSRVQDARRRAGHADRRQRQAARGRSTGVATHATPSSCSSLSVRSRAGGSSPSPPAARRASSACAAWTAASGAPSSSAATSAGSRHASSALPAPDVCAGIARPISVNSRTLRVPETLTRCRRRRGPRARPGWSSRRSRPGSPPGAAARRCAAGRGGPAARW